MFKTTRDGQVWLITQPAHAELAGKMAHLPVARGLEHGCLPPFAYPRRPARPRVRSQDAGRMAATACSAVTTPLAM